MTAKADTSSMHSCAACTRLTRRGQLMCGGCWRAVPKPLQVEVSRTWRAFERRKSPSEGKASLTAYRNACSAAVAAAQVGHAD